MTFEAVKKITVKISAKEATELEKSLAIVNELILKMKAENSTVISDNYETEIFADELVVTNRVLTQLARGGDDDGKLELY